MRKGKSLVVPYSKLFKNELHRFLPYLRTHSVISDYVNLDYYEKHFHSLPEPGLSLIRLVSFGVWYDARHDLEHLEKAKQTFEQFDFDTLLKKSRGVM